ncbi:HAD-IC family P-type ATPase [Antarcticibacterium flavum]|uniref:HAD-IC family P-type ATPase n=1 Tax=Antarcticibacterium flavum TaxID=2058175 RepID=A0A5B7X5W0_9FLAO|nr:MULTISPECIES: heavy metal translocating P-type ATPase metal-binding domain-containing protein [Antarcticibacterium]MCM4158327.1 heavy metal translocating P-type ATPase [Antarcticibacterium sp. W02-3]QCY70091.1 HAD-IC family P-type ATPase [Antarcticibacterium flavum]
MKDLTCYHCGDPILEDINFDERSFCCEGCKTVYEIFSSNDLSSYYEMQTAPGATPKVSEGKYDYLSNDSIIEKLLEFKDGKTSIVNLYIPHIHCSSCIWILENLNKLQPAINSSQVDFPKKSVRITFNSDNISLQEIVKFLSIIGYEPYISLNDTETGKKKINRSLTYKLGVSGFAFGNVMFLSFPEYFEVSEFWLDQYKHVFRWLMFTFSLPVVFYVSRDYFISAYKGIKAGLLNIDVPLALGIFVLFVRSTMEITFDWGTGFFDSLTGLVFFLTLGKLFQQKTYNFLSFERDYKSYFPIGVTRISSEGKEESVHVNDIKKGDRLLIRNEELIPVDCTLVKGKGMIDYSFVTGEAEAVVKEEGEKLFAGGKQVSGIIEIETLKSVSQSYLTRLWSNNVFHTNKELAFTRLIDHISQYFTVVLLLIATTAAGYWMFYDMAIAINVFTAVLIIACPCALAMSTPFTLGNILRIFGNKKFYLKNAGVIEQLAKANAVIFDKTGTITSNRKSRINYEGIMLTVEEEALLKNTLRASNHPLSRTLYSMLQEYDIVPLDEYTETVGKGMEARHSANRLKVGSAEFVGNTATATTMNTSVHISSNDEYRGRFIFHNEYREGVDRVFDDLGKEFHLTILSGDNEGEKERLQEILPAKTQFYFNRKPEDKLNYIKNLQEQGYKTIMVGDGLNDAGALAQSEVGIAVSENVNVFSPACDAILDASAFDKLYQFIKAARASVNIIKVSITLSFLYNVVGLYFAVTGQLSPVIAAILMPLSSISIIVFATATTNIIGRSIK